MTDRFEEAVRDAARGLDATVDPPSYHDAFRRGTRRRMVKRSALAAAGVLVFIAALTVNLGNVPGGDTTESDDVALDAEASTPTAEPTVPPTTAPVQAPTAAAAESPDSAGIQALPSLETPTAEADPTPQSTATPVPPAATSQPRPTTVPSVAAEAPTAVPTPEATPETTPTPRPTTTLEVAPTPTQAPFVLPSPTEVADGAAGTQLVPDDSTPGDQEPPAIAATIVADTPDATIVGRVEGPSGFGCDLDQDGVADAVCRLLPDYSCDGTGDVRGGYTTFDDDQDGSIDTCRAVGLTRCDSTGDGFSDTPCVIELEAEATTGE